MERRKELLTARCYMLAGNDETAASLFSAARGLCATDGAPLPRPNRPSSPAGRPPSRRRRRSGGHPRLNLRRHRHERLLDVGGRLRRGFQKGDPGLVGKRLGRRGVDNFLGLEVGLVADEELVDGLGGVAVDLREPLFDVVEGFLVGDVVDDLGNNFSTFFFESERDGADERRDKTMMPNKTMKNYSR